MAKKSVKKEAVKKKLSKDAGLSQLTKQLIASDVKSEMQGAMKPKKGKKRGVFIGG